MVDEAIFINAEGESFNYTDEAMVLNGWIIQQSAGIKDKNNTEIFDGDLLRGVFQVPEDCLDLILVVSIIDGCFCSTDKFGESSPVREDNSHCEIVGSIFELGDWNDGDIFGYAELREKYLNNLQNTAD